MKNITTNKKRTAEDYKRQRTGYPPHRGYAVIENGRVISKTRKWIDGYDSPGVCVVRLQDLDRFGYS